MPANRMDTTHNTALLSDPKLEPIGELAGSDAGLVANPVVKSRPVDRAWGQGFNPW
jgi:hypothetical protein